MALFEARFRPFTEAGNQDLQLFFGDHLPDGGEKALGSRVRLFLEVVSRGDLIDVCIRESGVSKDLPVVLNALCQFLRIEVAGLHPVHHVDGEEQLTGIFALDRLQQFLLSLGQRFVGDDQKDDRVGGR